MYHLVDTVNSFQYSFFFIFYRVATLFFEPLRFGLLYSMMSHKYDEDVKKSLR